MTVLMEIKLPQLICSLAGNELSKLLISALNSLKFGDDLE